jgi:uncharacterized phage protein (TIGR02218 family)
MKTISAPLQNHLSQDVTTLATCWKLTRRDGVVLGFTDHDRSLTIDSVIYAAATGFTPTAIAGSALLDVDNLEIEGMLDSETISEAEIVSGLYDFAEVEVFMVNYADLTQGIVSLRTGWVGEIMWNGTRFTAEIRGLTQKLSQTIGEIYSPTCRASLGDERCGVEMTSRTVTGTLTGVTSALILSDSIRTEIAGMYAGGVLTFLSGANEGVGVEVKAFQNTQFILTLPTPYLPSIGDAYRVTQGCDKRFETCKTVFSNAVNFRGEPHLAGMDRMLETSATRSM